MTRLDWKCWNIENFQYSKIPKWLNWTGNIGILEIHNISKFPEEKLEYWDTRNFKYSYKGYIGILQICNISQFSSRKIGIL